jgi:hypothetical protein
MNGVPYEAFVICFEDISVVFISICSTLLVGPLRMFPIS